MRTLPSPDLNAARLGFLSLACLGVLLAPSPAGAFCGFYVAGADTSLYANASMVVLMRDGTRTVLSMQNNYQGPPEDFALVIPVPTVLTKDQVKVLPPEVFAHVDTLSAPRLVEYWERDPCEPLWEEANGFPMPSADASSGDGDGVVVEAMFAVGEYDVVVLSASDSAGLDTWLRANDYNIPEGAEPVLEPYVAAGTKFFVAKVNPERVTFRDGQALLSPLRFYYDSPDFSLPVRLGLLNSQGTQDLIIHILAQERYELANYPNVTIPTNIRVRDEVRERFGDFYEALFEKTTEKSPGAVVTEYSWDASTCDPCPTPALDQQELATLGADVIAGTNDEDEGSFQGFVSFTLTRLHYRYTEDTLGEDLVFKRAPPIIGGRGTPDTEGNLEEVQASPSSYNNFQGRYIILHPWDKAMVCDEPARGFWGGPDGNTLPMTQGSMNTSLAGKAPTPARLEPLLAESLPELDVVASDPVSPFAVQSGGDCSCRVGTASSAAGTALLGLISASLLFRRKRRARGKSR